MSRMKLEALTFTLTFGLGVVALGGCGDKDTMSDDGGEETGEEGETGDGDGDGDCMHPIGEGAADGAPCTDNADCASNLCIQFSDAPPDTMATCAPPPDMCRTRVTGTVRDFESGMPVAGVDVRVVGAVGAASNPKGAKNLALGQTDADGKIDILTDEQITNQPLGTVAAVEGDGYYLTATGLESEPEEGPYPPGTTIHDIWAVPTTMLADWSALLEDDPDFAGAVPLGDLGGVVGMTRDGETGMPMAGVKIVPADPDTSGAEIRYLDETRDGFNQDQTASHGLFVIVDPGLGENFEAEMGGMTVPDLEGTAGSASGAVFTLIMDI